MYMYVCRCVCMYICLYEFIDVCICLYMSINLCKYVHFLYVCIGLYMCVHVYICLYVCIVYMWSCSGSHILQHIHSGIIGVTLNEPHTYHTAP